MIIATESESYKILAFLLEYLTRFDITFSDIEGNVLSAFINLCYNIAYSQRDYIFYYNNLLQKTGNVF